jgi:hypothetical protein
LKRTAAIKVLTILAVFWSGSLTVATGLAGDSERLQIPFEIDRNRVIVPTSVNGSAELDIILDTGMRFDGVYLFHQELLSTIDTTGAIRVRVPGAGGGEASSAVMIENGTLSFGGLQVDSQRVLVSRSSHTQTFPTDGAAGWNLFGHYIVEIDYDNQLSTLHDTSGVESDSTWTAVPVTLKKGLPFLECTVEVIGGEILPLDLYVDLASGDALELLVKSEQKFTLPDSLEERYLGTGLSGDVNGHFGHSQRLLLAGYELVNVPTAFAPAAVRSKQEGADGILGNDAIRRFNVIFDYPHHQLLLKPNSFFKTPFE